MFFGKKKRQVWDQFLVLGVFVATSSALLIYGGYVAWRNLAVTQAPPVAAVSSPLDPQAYQAASRDIVRPFFEQVQGLTPQGIVSGGADLAALAAKTRERLLNIANVPASERDAHLAMVLLLDKWRQAAQGSAVDRDNVLKQTQDLLSSQPWIMR